MLANAPNNPAAIKKLVIAGSTRAVSPLKLMALLHVMPHPYNSAMGGIRQKYENIVLLNLSCGRNLSRVAFHLRTV
jgi:hypothetical protein